ncbi:benzoate 4-monooxygenase cytochrome P450, partial [Metarhizium majus ARSEF 297]
MDDEMSGLAKLFASRVGEKRDRFNPRVEASDDGWSAPKNMAEWSDFFTFDVMSQLVFGTSYDLLTDAENHWIIDGVLGQMRRISFLTTLPELQDMGFHRILFPDARSRAIRFSMKSRQIMEARSQQQEKSFDGSTTTETPRKDIFSRLLTAKDPDTGEGLSQSQLWAESNLLIIAGSDTSSTGIAALFFYLTRNPSAYAKVAQEVRATFISEEDVSQGPKLHSCSYLRACVQEALRLAPAASGAMWREARDGGLQIQDTSVYIPSGCEVGTGIYSLNHNKVNFPNPFEFHPERWIASEAGEEAVRLAKLGFATFSFGPRNCVGKALAEVEIMLALAAVLRRFDFRSSDTDLGKVGEGEGRYAGQYHTFWAFTSLKKGPFLQFRQIE